MTYAYIAHNPDGSLFCRDTGYRDEHNTKTAVEALRKHGKTVVTFRRFVAVGSLVPERTALR
jgi:hypothetical protein